VAVAEAVAAGTCAYTHNITLQDKQQTNIARDCHRLAVAQSVLGIYSQVLVVLFDLCTATLTAAASVACTITACCVYTQEAERAAESLVGMGRGFHLLHAALGTAVTESFQVLLRCYYLSLL
jgi:hypothetical protein